MVSKTALGEQTWAGMLELQLISRHHPELRVIFGEHKVSNAFLVEGNIPAHSHVLPGLSFLQAFVIVRLQLYQWPKHILVNIRIVIPAAAAHNPLQPEYK